ncbi:MAG TPA: hypothetical protein VGR28_10515 [Candidatus Thermoplasmatota archaeon]|jgi:hypothetical protein|nr:hypothetical protein [Candidatus Thermoplasmatota archaeon]
MPPPSFLASPIPILFGTTPPMKRSQPQRKEELVRANVDLVKRLGPLCHGVVVYDVWEGNERGKFRTKYGDNRPFALRLRDETRKEVVVCNVVVHHDGLEGYGKWLDESAAQGLGTQVYVGASTDKFPFTGPHPREALKLAANRHPSLTKGCITIPWRFHEARRLAKKVELGATFALSQVVLEPVSGMKLVDELEKQCAAADLEPPLLLWNFAPAPDLDVALEDFDYFEVFPAPDNPEAHRAAQKNWDRIALAKDPLRESVEVAAENLEQLLNHCLRSRVPPGITVEGLGAQNLDYVEGLFRRLCDVRAGVVKQRYGLA